MIRVDVEDYCQSCLDFTPDVTPPTRLLSVDNVEVMQTDTIIQCEHRRRCSGIRRYLEKQIREEPVG